MYDQFRAALVSAAVFEASGLKASMEELLAERQRVIEEMRQKNIEKIRRALDQAKASPEPDPRPIAAYTRMLEKCESP